MHLTRLLFWISAVLAGAAVPAAAAVPLVAHRAVYDLALERASERSGITGLEGRMVYEFNGSACDGYSVTFRFVTRIATGETSRLTDQQTTSFEDGEGRTFDFVTRSYVDQNLDKEVKGSARLEADGLEVEVEKPQPNTIELPATQFPTQHMIELIGKAERGERFYETTLFDGSEDADRVMTTTVVIGKRAPIEGSDPEAAALGGLATDQVWPVDIAYFDLSDEAAGEETPEYRISFKLHENGVTRDLVMDYGDFSMTGRLVDLKLLEQPPAAAACDR